MEGFTITSFVPAQDLFALLDALDLEEEGETVEGDGFIRITFNNGVTAEIGASMVGEATQLDYITVSAMGGVPLVEVLDIGLIFGAEGIENPERAAGWTLALTAADDVVDADGGIAGFGLLIGESGTGGVDESALSGATIDFGEGTDTLIYAIARAEIAESVSEGGTISTVTPDGTSTLLGLERMELTDGTYLYDLSEEVPFVYRLYAAAFARTPDEAGLRFWDERFASGAVTADQLGDAFAASAEFAEKFLADPSDEAFIDALYVNVLGRAADDGGKAFWLNAFQTGFYDRGDMVEFFADSNENLANNADNYDDGVWVA